MSVKKADIKVGEWYQIRSLTGPAILAKVKEWDADRKQWLVQPAGRNLHTLRATNLFVEHVPGGPNAAAREAKVDNGMKDITLVPEGGLDMVVVGVSTNRSQLVMAGIESLRAGGELLPEWKKAVSIFEAMAHQMEILEHTQQRLRKALKLERYIRSMVGGAQRHANLLKYLGDGRVDLYEQMEGLDRDPEDDEPDRSWE